MSAEDPPTESRSGARTTRKQLPLWQETALLLVVAMVLAVVVKTFFVQAFYIPSGSMESTLQVNDRMLVQKVSYWRGEVQRGDVVVFDDPDGWLDASEERTAHNPLQRALEIFGLYPTGGHLVKRVIGVGGDRVTCCDKQGRLKINGVSVDEPYVKKPDATSEQRFSVKVPEGHLWVMGDNRGNSADSRAHMGGPGGGFLPVEDVIGKTWLVIWPWEHAGGVDQPTDFDEPALEASGGSG